MTEKDTLRELIREEIESQKRLDVNFYPARHQVLDDRLHTIYRFLILIALIAFLILLLAAFDYFNVGQLRTWLTGEEEVISQTFDSAASKIAGEAGDFESYFAGHSIGKTLQELPHTLQSHKEVFAHTDSEESAAAQTGLYGPDISHWQKSVDWQKVLQDTTYGRFSFFIIKATQGSSIVDPRFETNWSSAAQSSARLGAYHYFTFDDDPNEQARNFISTVSLRNGDFPPILDVEKKCQTCSELESNLDEVKGNLRVMLNLLEQHYGAKPLIYTDEDLFERYLGDAFPSYNFWIAKYSKSPPPALQTDENPDQGNGARALIWQFTDDGHVPGIVGDVNLNFMPKSSLSAIQFIQ